MREFSTSPREMAASLWRHRELTGALVKREVIGRYRGSFMGLAWSFLNPLFMLAIFTFVFSTIFGMRWAGLDQGIANVAIVIFTGMIIHGLFAECVNRAPSLILANTNYVKKVVFPLEILAWVAFNSALFHAMASLLVLLTAQIIVQKTVHWTALFFPVVLLPLAFVTMGVSWFLAAIGMYIRDIGQFTGILTTALLFMSPVMYPLSAVPEPFRTWFMLNPLTPIIEQGRNTLIFGKLPDFGQLAIMLAVSLLIAWIGFAWFQKSRKGFADVL